MVDTTAPTPAPTPAPAPADRTEPVILTHVEEGVCTITLNRPAALNSFTVPMHKALRAALTVAAQNDAVRCVVITGAGRAFCAGQDLAEVSGQTQAPGVGDLVAEHYKPLALQIRKMPVPVIAAVNGVAAGAGANFALGCDMVVAAESAVFMQAFSKIGLVPDCGGTYLLPRMLGRATALGLALTAHKLKAAEAQRMGLIWQCVEDAKLGEAVRALALQLAGMPTQALVATRAAMDAALHMNYEQALSEEGRLQTVLAAAHDYQEGVDAFLNKRAPVFKDRGR